MGLPSGLDHISQDLRLDTAPEASLVFDRDNNVVFSFASEDRTNVSLEQVSDSMISAVLAAEDRNFFTHAGMDIVGLARAAWVDLKAQAIKQGGSTITQQLVRQVALMADRNFERKLKEALLALRVERRFGKEQIPEAYLNRIYFGNGHYGVQAASRGYFGKPASGLDIAESALLAGLIPCPSVCSPRVAPTVATTRRNHVLKVMLENGAISQAAYRDAVASPISLATLRHEGALVALDPQTGEVLALVGGRDFHTSSSNRATQAKRQPGSAFKPLLFATAIEQGYMPSSLLTGMDTPIQTAQGEWLPSGEHEASSYTLRQALTVSSNRAAVRVMQLVGITTTQTYARRLGISSPLPAVPSLALGTGEVTLLDLTSAYSAFANDGIIAPHTLIRRVEDRDGNLLWQSSLERHTYRAVRPGTAYLMSSMMADVMNRGTGSRARSEAGLVFSPLRRGATQRVPAEHNAGGAFLRSRSSRGRRLQRI